MAEFGKIGLLFLLSATKFFLAPFATVAAGYGVLTSILLTSIGGCVGFIVFFKFGTLIKRGIQALIKPKKKRVFTKKNRLIVKVKSKYGFYGIAVLTPCLLSVPLGAILASVYFSGDRRTIPVFLSLIVIWSVLLSSLSFFMMNYEKI